MVRITRRILIGNAGDSGWFKTATMNLDRVTAFAVKNPQVSQHDVIADRAQRLKQNIESAPKTLRWQTRTRLGESVRWHESPSDPHSSTRPDMASGQTRRRDE